MNAARDWEQREGRRREESTRVGYKKTRLGLRSSICSKDTQSGRPVLCHSDIAANIFSITFRKSRKSTGISIRSFLSRPRVAEALIYSTVRYFLLFISYFYRGCFSFLFSRRYNVVVWSLSTGQEIGDMGQQRDE